MLARVVDGLCLSAAVIDWFAGCSALFVRCHCGFWTVWFYRVGGRRSFLCRGGACGATVLESGRRRDNNNLHKSQNPLGRLVGPRELGGLVR